MVLGDLDSYMQKNETWAPTYTMHKNKLKMYKRLKYNLWYYKSPRGQHRQENLRYPPNNMFTDMFPTASNIKKRINKWDFVKINSFCMAKGNINKMKREPTVWENNFPIFQTRVWSPKYIKDSHESTPGRQTIQLKNGQRT